MQGLAVFQDPDSTVLAMMQTDGDGGASATMAAGGSVTLIVGNQFSQPRLITFAGVCPGDVLRLSEPPIVTSRTIEVSIPTMPPMTEYSIGSSCSDTTPAVTVPDPSAVSNVTIPIPVGSCSTADVIAWAWRDGDAERKVFVALSVPLTSAITVHGSYHAPQASTVNITNIVSDPSEFYVVQRIMTANRDISADDISPVVTSPSYTASFEQAVLVSQGTFQRTEVDVLPANAPPYSSRSAVVAWGPFTGSVDVDFAAMRHRKNTSMPTYDAATRSMQWTEEPEGRAPDAALAGIRVERAEADGGPFGWEIIAPIDGPRVTFPRLPVLQRDFNPTAADVVYAYPPTTYAVTVPGLAHTGYDVIREHILGDLYVTYTPDLAGIMTIEN